MSVRSRIGPHLDLESLGSEVRERIHRLETALQDVAGGDGAPEDFDPQNFPRRESMSSGFVKTAVLNVGEVCHGDEKKLDSDVVKLQTFRNLQSVSSFKSRCARTSNNDTNSCTCRRQALSTTS